MKGLLLKDYYTLLKQAKIFVLLIIAFSLIPGVYMSAVALCYAAMLPITALAYDERAKWDSLAAMMPYSARDIVFSKYLLGYIGILAAGTITSAAKMVSCLIKHTTVGPEDFLTILLTACVAAVMLAFNLPVMFKLGVEKGRIAFFVLIAAVAVAGTVLGEKLVAVLDSFSGNVGMIGLDAVVITIVLSLISVLMSTAFYKRLEK